jgi:tetratricopeptide (TPR) repeat protein
MKRARAKTNRASSRLPRAGGLLDVSLNSPPSLTGGAPIILCPSAQESSKHVWQSTTSQYAPLGFTTPAAAGKASASNRTQVDKNRLVIVATSIQSEVVASLSRQAESAYILRQPDKVDAICTQLEQAHAPIASYFRGLVSQRNGNGDLSEARKQLEQAINHAPRNYQARALLALGSIAEYQKDYRAELEFYQYALSLNESDVFTAVETRRAIAISEAKAGNHKRSIDLLESILPLAQHNPYLFGQLLNHLAVYYHQTGRLKDALRLAQMVCASPLVSVYHEWNETREEIQQEIAEQESRAVIVAAPNVRSCAQSRAGKQARASIDLTSITGAYSQPIVLATMAKTSIQSRLRYSFSPHAPPFRAGK